MHVQYEGGYNIAYTEQSKLPVTELTWFSF